MADFRRELGPDELLLRYAYLFRDDLMDLPVLDLACGDGHNGIFLAAKGFPVVLADKSEEALKQAKSNAAAAGVSAEFWRIDLEEEGIDPLEGRTFGGVIVFRYLHRPLIPCIRRSLIKGGILLYETFTAEQARLSRPKNPDHLLKPGELLSWFRDWEVIHTYEGTDGHPPKAISRLVCRKTL